MPRVTSQKFIKTRVEASGSQNKGKAKDVSGEGARNPLFNTERFGQHILKNPQVAQSIVDKAGLKPTDQVLEVGPGTGNLTVRILEKCKHCTAVEMDPRMAAELVKRVQGKPEQKRLDIVVGDFIKTELTQFDICISNTPYQISSPLIFKLLSHRPLFRTAILMFQQEFALRLIARPGSSLWSRLSVNVQLYAKVDLVLKVSRNNFRPPPQVDSAVVRICPMDPPPAVAFEEFDGLARICFNRRNKEVRANFQAKGVVDLLKHNYITRPGQPDMVDEVQTKAMLESILAESGYAEKRAAKMDINDFLELLSAFNRSGFHFS